jgi:hypothetical protein
MSNRRPLAQPRNPLLRKICTYLLKGYGTGLLIFVVTSIMLYFFGFVDLAAAIMTLVSPWIVRLSIAVSCTLLITSFSEAI